MKTLISVGSNSTGSFEMESAAGGQRRFIGLDVGAENLKLVEVLAEGANRAIGRCAIVEHGKRPGECLGRLLKDWDWASVTGASITGRFSSQVNLPRVPAKQAVLRGYQFWFGDEPVTLVNIGSHGFYVLEWRANGTTAFRENSRCSQGTGNFLRQLVERFSLSVEEASLMCAEVSNPAPLSGRCPVILKTDMTHLANKGEDRARILAGLFDAVCENVSVLIKPGISPSRVLLTGGVCRAPRVRRILGESLARQGMTLLPSDREEWQHLEALGCALLAAEQTEGTTLPGLPELLLPPRDLKLDRLPALAKSLPRVRHLPHQPLADPQGGSRRLVLGFDIGSTGSKAVALDAVTQETVWEAYRQTLGDPVGAAQALLKSFSTSSAAEHSVIGFGATGSGREIAGSLLAACYGREAAFVVNEIVAHATGALHYDPRVDTIFEIGGQDAKYTRLAEGRIVDCAMNEACSAGTGSFIAEQGCRFEGIQDVQQLSQAALAADSGVSLGQHCSVFMAEVIDEAVAAGVEQPAIISGLYDSIIKNYLNRVKGNRSVGKVIFCQGMPFSSGALAAAVARQTGSEVIVPPKPGLIGALGIALLAATELGSTRAEPLDLSKFMEARVEEKDSFLCASTRGCGGAGNHCRIERLCTRVAGQRSKFTWGGGCALHDRGTRKRKLPDLAPDPFRERTQLRQAMLAPLLIPRGGPRVAISDEFMLKELFPFFAAYFHAAGFDLQVVDGSQEETLRRGIQAANTPFCAPMQLFHGVAAQLAATGADWMFIPMIRSMRGVPGQRHSVVCPIVQAAPKVTSGGPDCASPGRPRLLAPVIDVGAGHLDGAAFRRSCTALADALGLDAARRSSAWEAGYAAQHQFDEACQVAGRRALDFCRQHAVVPVVVLGRDYTIHHARLNSNVPSILREQGAIGIPVDCYPLEPETPLFADMYWAYGQRVLRAAHQVRRQSGVYALYCSNYSCGPDSFSLHFTAHTMAGKPFAVIETDGHSGDAGTRTRVEAFLHCVEEDRHADSTVSTANDFGALQHREITPRDFAPHSGSNETLLLPFMGPSSQAVAAVFRGQGFRAESLPEPDAESLRIGRRYTSGKECLPMPLTLGTLLQRLNRASADEKFVYLMPGTHGPCRFGVYHLLSRLLLDQLGWRDRVRIWSPQDSGYFDGLSPGTEMLVFASIAASDLLLQAQLDVRPLERLTGEADRLYQDYFRQLLELLETVARGDLSLGTSLWQVASGRLFGLRDLLSRAGQDFAALRAPGQRPRVALVGEIYVRGVDSSNDHLIGKLEARGLQVHVAPRTEWFNYCSHLQCRKEGRNRVVDGFSRWVQHRIEGAALAAIAPALGWQAQPTAAQALAAAAPYVDPALEGEAVLTVGAPLLECRHGHVDAVVSVGPLECMPGKIAEAQWQHISEREGIPFLALSFNGDPVNETTLDNFAYEVKERHLAHSARNRRNRGSVPARMELESALQSS